MTAHQQNLKMERRQTFLIGASAAAFIVVGCGFVFVIAGGAYRFLSEPGRLGQLLAMPWDPLVHQFGVLSFVMGSAIVTALSVLLAYPFAMALAVTGSVVLRSTGQRVLTQILTVYSAVPSVIYGWWGLTVVVPAIRTFLGGPGFSLLAAGIVLGLMILPTMSIWFQTALKAVPETWQEGSLALGASEDQTLWRLIFPVVRPSLMRGTIVAVGRAVGETMAVQMVIGGHPGMASSLLQPGSTLTTQILMDMTAFPPGTPGHYALDAMALILLGMMYLLVRLGERAEGRSR